MKKVINNQEEEKEPLKIFETTIECTDYVEQLLTERPTKKNKVAYKEWEETLSFYASLANKLSKYNIYALKEMSH